jgi:hypothetical protein
MGQLTLSGVLQAGPANAVDGQFPGGSINEPLCFISGTKLYVPGTGILTRNVVSPAAFLTLDGVGTLATVTHGTFLYLKCNAPMIVQMTCDDGTGTGTVIVEQAVHGLLMLEFPTANALQLLKVKGSGTLEYLVVGNL